MLGGYPLSLIGFVMLVTMLAVGLGTLVIWVGVPMMMIATQLIYGLAAAHRGLIKATLGVQIPTPRRERTGSVLQKWRQQLTDAQTWRNLAYLMITFPISVVEFALAIAGTIILPIGIWVLPFIASLHAQLAMALLGPNTAAQLSERAQRLQASRARGVDAAEAERRRIERDLHDGAQQRLVAVAMGLGRAQKKFEADPDGAKLLVGEALADAKLAVSELRDLARGIYPAVLGDRGLDAALSSLAAKSPVPVNVQVTVDPRPPAAVESTAYFIVGESLTNVAKYANASQVTVKVWREERPSGDMVVVEVTDDGDGGAVFHAGGGLAGLADRAATIDGVMTVVSPIGGPTVIRADLPCTW
ncbi:MAG TPA: sensor domain-containing protein [Actinophytocola sp.]|uniref:sensor histidine kinase n=1 Tax=Actinophytocola sp. TaxID=1872138 RepID=UPI002DBFB0AB|nr:sensor domain-containing protein [Actinophytocola sp.]HEU5474890.1 sensor domain-containing protein [Actinophytocola sp.]